MLPTSMPHDKLNNSLCQQYPTRLGQHTNDKPRVQCGRGLMRIADDPTETFPMAKIRRGSFDPVPSVRLEWHGDRLKVVRVITFRWTTS